MTDLPEPGSTGSSPAEPSQPVTGQDRPQPAAGAGTAIVRYTVWRIVILVVAWLLLYLLTPLRGVLALAIALVASGVISYFVLDRQREAMGATVGGFFGRLNRRIEEGKRTEDDD